MELVTDNTRAPGGVDGDQFDAAGRVAAFLREQAAGLPFDCRFYFIRWLCDVLTERKETDGWRPSETH